MRVLESKKPADVLMESFAVNPIAVVWQALFGGTQCPELGTKTRSDSANEEARLLTALEVLPDFFRKQLISSSSRSFQNGGGPPHIGAGCFKEATIHIRQEYDWDCGIACLQMALYFLSKEHADTKQSTSCAIERGWLEDRIGTQSTWSIDLVAILDHVQKTQENQLASFEYLFCSKQLALNHNLEAMGYYAPSFAQDAVRVQRLYDKLKTHSSQNLLQHHDLSLEVVLFCVQHDNCLAIILVDNTVLQSKVKGVDCMEVSGPFVGHYVLLLRVLGKMEVLLHDPGRPRPIIVAADDLHAAWQTPGTDADVILLARR